MTDALRPWATSPSPSPFRFASAFLPAGRVAQSGPRLRSLRRQGRRAGAGRIPAQGTSLSLGIRENRCRAPAVPPSNTHFPLLQREHPPKQNAPLGAPLIDATRVSGIILARRRSGSARAQVAPRAAIRAAPARRCSGIRRRFAPPEHFTHPPTDQLAQREPVSAYLPRGVPTPRMRPG
jgi:hypothetical protein